MTEGTPLPSPPLPSPPFPLSLPLVTQQIHSPFQPKQSPSLFPQPAKLAHTKS